MSVLQKILNEDVVEKLKRHGQVPYQAYPSSKISVVYEL